MRRLVEASRVRILRLSVAGPGGLVESRPELHMELVMTTRGCSWIPLATRRLIPSWRSPHRTPAAVQRSRGARPSERLRVPTVVLAPPSTSRGAVRPRSHVLGRPATPGVHGHSSGSGNHGSDCSSLRRGVSTKFGARQMYSAAFALASGLRPLTCCFAASRNVCPVPGSILLKRAVHTTTSTRPCAHSAIASRAGAGVSAQFVLCRSSAPPK